MIARRQRGVALITAMLIFALVGSLVVDLAWEHALDTRRTMTQLFRDEATQAALGAESWMSIALTEDAANTQEDHLGEFWAQELPALPIESSTVQGTIQGALEDLQGRFNVNSLVDSNGNPVTEYVEQFERLLIALDLDPRFARLTVDWIDPDQLETPPDGAEDITYSGYVPTYLTANRYLSSASELAALDGMEPAAFAVLAPHIVALPPDADTINVNTATWAVLQSLDPSLDAGQVELWLEERAEAGFVDYQGAFQPFVSDPVILQRLVNSSEYFQLKVVVQIATVRVHYNSVLFRRPGSTVPILRSYGTL